MDSGLESVDTWYQTPKLHPEKPKAALQRLKFPSHIQEYCCPAHSLYILPDMTATDFEPVSSQFFFRPHLLQTPLLPPVWLI